MCLTTIQRRTNVIPLVEPQKPVLDAVVRADLTKSPLEDQDCSNLSSANNFQIPFPWKLHEMLQRAENEGMEDVISWLPELNGFKVHDKTAFMSLIMPRYFKQTKYKSFQRQLNLWGFERVAEDCLSKGGYTHTRFVRGKPYLCRYMRRQKIKGCDAMNDSGHSKECREQPPSSPLKTQTQSNTLATAPCKFQSSIPPTDLPNVISPVSSASFLSSSACGSSTWWSFKTTLANEKMVPQGISMVPSPFASFLGIGQRRMEMQETPCFTDESKMPKIGMFEGRYFYFVAED